MAAHRLPDVTIVADAGMVSEANQKQIEAAGLSFILSFKLPQSRWLPSPVLLRPDARFCGWLDRPLVTRRLEHVPRVAEVALGEREDLCRSHREHQDALVLVALEAVIARLVLPAAVPLARPDFC